MPRRNRFENIKRTMENILEETEKYHILRPIPIMPVGQGDEGEIQYLYLSTGPSFIVAFDPSTYSVQSIGKNNDQQSIIDETIKRIIEFGVLDPIEVNKMKKGERIYFIEKSIPITTLLLQDSYHKAIKKYKSSIRKK